MNIFLDTETNSLGKPYIVEIAFNGTSIKAKPQEPIEIGASAVNHIRNKDVEHYLPFQENPLYPAVKALLEHPDTVVIAHNAEFDLRALRNENIFVTNSICTKILAKKKWPEAPSHSLQNLRYWLDLDVRGVAHSGSGDVEVLMELWKRLA